MMTGDIWMSYGEADREKMYGEVSPDRLISKWLRNELKIDLI